jgi:phosphoglycolate phosphatase
MAELLTQLEESGVPWGVVSNKREAYVRPILQGLGLHTRCVAMVGGDTTAHAKPHPEPLLHAARLAGVVARGCVYIGDDLRDIQAGAAAGMRTVAAAYGYISASLPPEAWEADAVVSHPAALAPLLGLKPAAA